MPRLFRLGYLEIGRDAYIARGDSRNMLSTLNTCCVPANLSIHSVIAAIGVSRLLILLNSQTPTTEIKEFYSVKRECFT